MYILSQQHATWQTDQKNDEKRSSAGHSPMVQKAVYLCCVTRSSKGPVNHVGKVVTYSKIH